MVVGSLMRSVAARSRTWPNLRETTRRYRLPLVSALGTMAAPIIMPVPMGLPLAAGVKEAAVPLSASPLRCRRWKRQRLGIGEVGGKRVGPVLVRAPEVRWGSRLDRRGNAGGNGGGASAKNSISKFWFKKFGKIWYMLI